MSDYDTNPKGNVGCPWCEKSLLSETIERKKCASCGFALGVEIIKVDGKIKIMLPCTLYENQNLQSR